MRGRAPTERHARCMDDIARIQLSGASDRGLAYRHGTMRGALVLYRSAAAAPYRSRHAATEQQVVVGRVDDGIDLLLDQVAGDDHDPRGSDSFTSSTRSSSCARVAPRMPRSPMSAMVSAAQATPHTSDSFTPFGSPPVDSQRASMPAAIASPAPVVSITGRSVSAGTCTDPSCVYAVTPRGPAFTTRPSRPQRRRNDSGSSPPSASNSSRLQKYQFDRVSTSRASGGWERT